jgi:hypothetical protein
MTGLCDRRMSFLARAAALAPLRLPGVARAFASTKAGLMSDLVNGILVRHTSLGVGKIVALEPNAVHVFFRDADKRFAAKLRLPAARALLRTDGFEPDGWLQGLSAFTLDPATGRYGLAASWLTHEQALDQFLAVYPEGFTDPDHIASDGGKSARVSRWRAAHEAWAAAFGNGQGERLVADDDLKELVKRALKIEALIAPLHPPADDGAVKEALSDEETTRTYFAALVELVSVPSPGRARFEKLFAAAGALPVEPAQQWLVATLFPFLASPQRHVLLRPKVTCVAADRLGYDLRYESYPNWATYSALRTVGTRLIEQLAPNGATDFADLESFLHVTASAKRTTARQDGAASTAKPRAARRAAARSTT